MRRERKGVGKFIRECMDLKGREKRGEDGDKMIRVEA